MTHARDAETAPDDEQSAQTRLAVGARTGSPRGSQSCRGDRGRGGGAVRNVAAFTSRDPAIVALRGNAEQARQFVLSRHAPALARLAPDERRLVETITTQVVARLLHEATIELRQMRQGHAP